ncbi:MAG: [FeFe] hydrogenase H-cluster radical SAM maturase HydE [Candidatus Omnitrophica bacterium]|nr:[FeFe] hydrogenase H-cluster radical SAM maturase HydE [Candidatus Omnitrophota bacterium]
MFDAKRIELDKTQGIIIYSVSKLSAKQLGDIQALYQLVLVKNRQILKQYIVYFLQNNVEEILFKFADIIRKIYCGDEIHLRGLIEFSNYCARDCLYCGLRKDNKAVLRYRLSSKEIIDIAKSAMLLNYKTVVLQSGEDYAYSIEQLCDIVREIKQQTDCAITLSVGERGLADYQKLRQAGAERYLLRFETSNQELFKKLKPDSDYKARIKCLKDLKQSGFQVGSGCMIGLPGQTAEIIAEDILLMLELDLDMIGIGPFISNPETPLQSTEKGSVEMMRKVIALVRILTKNTHLPATTAVGSIDPQGRQKVLRCGANVIMPNLTPQMYREHYRIYPDKICVKEDPDDCHGCVGAMTISLGRTIAKGYGHSLKTKRA